MYAAVLASFTSTQPPLPLPGMHFFVGATFLIGAWALARFAFAAHAAEAEAAAATGAPAEASAM